MDYSDLVFDFQDHFMISTVDSEAVLALEDGTLFYGRSNGSLRTVCGEIVFNTSMTGYQEICTDPSYADQIVLFTTTHIGNVGVNDQDAESSRPWVKGIITREMSKTTSNWRSNKSLINFLGEHHVPWIEGIDTRKLTRHIRKYGTKNACLMVGIINTELAIELAKSHVNDDGLDLSQIIQKIDFDSLLEPNFLNYKSSSLQVDAPRIVVYDFGVKSNILKSLHLLDCEVIVIHNTMSAIKLFSYNPDGIIISNGPGDPASMREEIEEIQQLIISGIPVLGICLGCQLIAIAGGGRTKKMKFGHHGTNHPVYNIKLDKVYITSQNHNFVIDENSFPSEFEITHTSLVDGSVQGIKSKNYPVVGFQGHPEGSPGPDDMMEVFQEFLNLSIDAKQRRVERTLLSK